MMSTLPPEIVLLIASYLKDGAYISFAYTSKRFLHLLSSDRRELNLSTEYIGNLSYMKTFLFGSQRTATITKLDLANCYWYDPSLLTELITGLSSSLTSLHIQGTKLSSFHVAKILKECSQIIELSVSFSDDDSSFWLTDGDAGSWIPSIKDTVFHTSKHNLEQLKRLSLHGTTDLLRFRNFLGFLSGCKNIESLHFEVLYLHQIVPKRISRDQPVHELIRDVNMYNRSASPFSSLKRITSSVQSSVYNESFFANHIMEMYLIKRRVLDMLTDIAGSREICDALWFLSYDDNTEPNSYLKQDCCALLIVEDQWSDQVLNFKGLHSLFLRSSLYSRRDSRFLEKAITMLPNLKLLSCPYISKAFLDFAMNHTKLRVLQLDASNSQRAPAGPELAEGLSCLKQLEKFSIDAGCFRGCESADSLNLVVAQLAKSCAFLNEIEIGVSVNSCSAMRHDDVCKINCCALEMISKCSHLERLTLENLQVDSNSFLLPILTGCSRLKSLRLTNVHSSSDTIASAQNMINQLKQGLPLPKSLLDFKWEIGQCRRVLTPLFNEPSNAAALDMSLLDGVLKVEVSDLLDALKLCPSLRRFVIIGDLLDLNGTGSLDCSSLVLACIISPTVDWENCELKINSDQRAFQSYLGASKGKAAGFMASHHYREMIMSDSNVAKMPYDHV